jgi:hypothetical protein
VLQQVLAVGRAVFHAAHHAGELTFHVVNAEVDARCAFRSRGFPLRVS